MKELDIDKLSKAMPYKPLEESYFEQLPLETLARLNSEGADALFADDEPAITTPLKRWTLAGRSAVAAAIVSVAAAVMVVLYVSVGSESQSVNTEEQISEFIATLSDSDLELIITEAESNYEFYTNL